MLVLTDVAAGYDGTEVLKGVSLSIPEGSITALLGRNGMGKTTTIRTIIGLVRASAGAVHFAGHDLTDLPIHRRAQLGIGLVPETRQVFRSLTVAEHLRVAARPGPNGENDWPLDRLVELFPVLARRSSARGNQLSGGEQQLLVIARALTTNPSLILLDEPTEGLAPAIVNEIAVLLRRLRGEPNAPSILVVEQNLRFALSIADTAYVLVKGEVAYHGPAGELAADSDTQHELIGIGTA